MVINVNEKSVFALVESSLKSYANILIFLLFCKLFPDYFSIIFRLFLRDFSIMESCWKWGD